MNNRIVSQLVGPDLYRKGMAATIVGSNALNLNKAMAKTNLQGTVNDAEEEGKVPMITGDFNKNSELRKMAVELAIEKIASELHGHGSKCYLCGEDIGPQDQVRHGTHEEFPGVYFTAHDACAAQDEAEAQKTGSEKQAAGIPRPPLSIMQAGREGFGKGIGGAVGEALVNGGMTAGKLLYDAFISGHRSDKILTYLMHTDDIIGKAPPERVIEAFSTMKRFAPTLSSDINAVRSYLRECLTLGAGADYALISNIVKAENMITKGRE